MKKRKINFDELMAKFTPYEERLREEADKLVPFVRVEQTCTKDGYHTVYLCPKCEHEFEDTRGYTSLLQCPHCRHRATRYVNAGTAESIIALMFAIWIKEADRSYLATGQITQSFNEGTLESKTGNITYRCVSEIKEEPIEVTSYYSKEKKRTTASLYGSHVTPYLLNICISEGFETFKKKDDISRFINNIDRKMSAIKKLKSEERSKKEEEVPTETSEEITLPSLKDFFGITVAVISEDTINRIYGCKAKCYHCGNEWLFEAGEYQTQIECPYCGAVSKNTNRLTIGSRVVGKRLAYISSTDEKVTVRVIHANWPNNELEPELTGRLVGYYEITPKRSVFYQTKTNSDKKLSKVTYKGMLSGIEYEAWQPFVLNTEGLLQYSGIEEFIKNQRKNSSIPAENLMRFICDTVKYPVIEKIVKEGLITEYLNQKVVDYSATTAYEAFGLPKAWLKAYKQAKKVYGLEGISYFQDMYKSFPDASTDDVIWVAQHQLWSRYLTQIQSVVPELTAHQIISYLERVRLNQLYGPKGAAVEWRDYLDACRSIGMDMTDRKVLYPRALKTEHDIVVAKKTFITDESIKEDFMKAVEDYKRLEYHRDDYFIKTPESTQDMLEEGRKLNHCCGRYIDDVAKKQAFVLFLRKKVAPDTPFLSIEVLPDMTVRQVRGINDSYTYVQPDHKEISIFLTHWAKAKHLTLKIV